MARTERFVSDRTAKLLPEDGDGTRIINSFAIKPTEAVTYGDVTVEANGDMSVIGGAGVVNAATAQAAADAAQADADTNTTAIATKQGNLTVFKAIGSSTASIANTSVFMTWSAPTHEHPEITLSESSDEITFGTGGTYTLDITARCTSNERTELLLSIYNDIGVGHSIMTNEIASDYVSRDTDQNTGGVTLSTALTVGDGEKLKFQAEGDCDGTCVLTASGSILRIIGPY